MSQGEHRDIKESALDGVAVLTPCLIGDYKFIHSRIESIKEYVEEDCGQTFSVFTAHKFIKNVKKDYIIRVDCGGDRFIDIELHDHLLMQFHTDKKLDDPMEFLN